MKAYISILFCLVTLLPAGITAAQPADEHGREMDNCRKKSGTADCASDPAWCKNNEDTCNPEMRGRCGKRRGDWYGASKPVLTAAEARRLLDNYFVGKDYTVSAISEKKWGFKADILDKNSKIVDRIMLDKRSGRIRSIY